MLHDPLFGPRIAPQLASALRWHVSQIGVPYCLVDEQAHAGVWQSNQWGVLSLPLNGFHVKWNKLAGREKKEGSSRPVSKNSDAKSCECHIIRTKLVLLISVLYSKNLCLLREFQGQFYPFLTVMHLSNIPHVLAAQTSRPPPQPIRCHAYLPTRPAACLLHDM